MYEQNEVPVLRRIVLLALWFILIVAILWVAVWFVFFRDDSKKSADTSSKSTQSQSQNKDNATDTDNGSSTPAPSSATTGTNGATAPTSSTPVTTSTPDELANTGAGNVVAPALGAMIVGSAIYYIRLRHKVTN